MATDSPKTDIFRFMSVRPAKRVTPSTSDKKFIKYSNGPSTFFQNLESELSATDPRSAVIAEAAAAEGTSTIYADQVDLFSDFTNFDRIFEFIFENLKTVTKTQLTSEIETQIGTTISTYLGGGSLSTNTLKVWDSLFYISLVTKDTGFAEQLMMTLRVLRIMSLIDSGSPLVDFNEGIQQQVKANIILPKPVFPLPKEELTDSNTNQDISDQPDQSALLQEIDDLKEAREDIIQTYERQKSESRSSFIDLETFTHRYRKEAEENPTTAPSAPPASEVQRMYDDYTDKGKPFAFNEKYAQELSSNTTNTITNLGFRDAENTKVSDLVKSIDHKLEKKFNALNSTYKKKQLILVGSTMVVVDPEKKIKDTNAPQSETVPKALVQPLGIGDMHVVREELLKYEEGEIAHIENILAKEKKLKSHTSLSRTESSELTETFSETESETSSRSASQLEMSQAMRSEAQSANQSAAGIEISATYGTVSANAFAQSSAQSSSYQSESQSTNVAKQVSESARERVLESVRSLRTKSEIREITIVNEHEVDNTAAEAGHIIGQYHWIDKKYLNQVFNIGKRLMYEFVIPEPAAFYIYSQTRKPSSGLPEVPVHPFAEELANGQELSHQLVDVASYGKISARGKVEGVEPPPPEYLQIGTALTNPNLQGYNLDSYNDSLKVPEGYVGTEATVLMSYSGGGDKYVAVKVGGVQAHSNAGQEQSFALDDLSDKVPVSVHSGQTYYAVNVVVQCTRTDKAFTEWQLSTFNRIMRSYYDAMDQYNFEVERIKSGDLSETNVKGKNPLENRKIEQIELKKSAIKFLTSSRFDGFDSMLDNFSEHGYPDFMFNESLNEGSIIKFFEQAFEWNEITYHHYPYFWGRKENWIEVMNLEDTDPKFTSFLTAGATRVVVPVRPEFTRAMLHYQNTGEIWAGQDIPDLDDELYLSLADEIQSANSDADGDPIGDPWIVKLPTNLVRLNASTTPELPDHTDELL